MDILNFADDMDKKTDGVVIKLSKDAFIRVAAFGSPAFYEAMRVNRDRIADDPLNPTTDDNRQAYIEAFAETVLIDWGGLTEAGEAVKYSVEKAIEWLSDPAKVRFLEKVETESRRIENYQVESLKREKKD